MRAKESYNKNCYLILYKRQFGSFFFYFFCFLTLFYHSVTKAKTPAQTNIVIVICTVYASLNLISFCTIWRVSIQNNSCYKTERQSKLTEARAVKCKQRHYWLSETVIFTTTVSISIDRSIQLDIRTKRFHLTLVIYRNLVFIRFLYYKQC